jgi:hypothetical protein
MLLLFDEGLIVHALQNNHALWKSVGGVLPVVVIGCLLPVEASADAFRKEGRQHAVEILANCNSLRMLPPS